MKPIKLGVDGVVYIRDNYGYHNFTAFDNSEKSNKHTVKRLLKAGVLVKDSAGQNLLSSDAELVFNIWDKARYSCSRFDMRKFNTLGVLVFGSGGILRIDYFASDVTITMLDYRTDDLWKYLCEFGDIPMVTEKCEAFNFSLTRNDAASFFNSTSGDYSQLAAQTGVSADLLGTFAKVYNNKIKARALVIQDNQEQCGSAVQVICEDGVLYVVNDVNPSKEGTEFCLFASGTTEDIKNVLMSTIKEMHYERKEDT